MLRERVVNALTAWLNGDVEHAWLGEGLNIMSATLNGERVVITFVPTDDGEVPFLATFDLTSLELRTKVEAIQ